MSGLAVQWGISLHPEKERMSKMQRAIEEELATLLPPDTKIRLHGMKTDDLLWTLRQSPEELPFEILHGDRWVEFSLDSAKSLQEMARLEQEVSETPNQLAEQLFQTGLQWQPVPHAAAEAAAALKGSGVLPELTRETLEARSLQIQNELFPEASEAEKILHFDDTKRVAAYDGNTATLSVEELAAYLAGMAALQHGTEGDGGIDGFLAISNQEAVDAGAQLFGQHYESAPDIVPARTPNCDNPLTMVEFNRCRG